MENSILDDLGEEITRIIAPVTICMLATVTLVRILNPESSSIEGVVYIAEIYYREDDEDSTGAKIKGSFMNALIFTFIIGAMTFILMFMFKSGCTKVIRGYMCFSGFTIFFFVTGMIILQVMRKVQLHLDLISFSYYIFNFAIIGTTALFLLPVPLLLKQSYLILTAVTTAYIFTWIPQWTTWFLLVAMSIYDVVAVLTPGGPLNMLLKVAEERDEDIPALIYEARQTINDTGLNPEIDSQNSMFQNPSQWEDRINDLAPHNSQVYELPCHSDNTSWNLTNSRPTASSISRGNRNVERNVLESSSKNEEVEETNETEENPEILNIYHCNNNPNISDQIIHFPDSIKLGLGDFIFYSLLMGRASMNDWMSVAACYVAIIAGLGMTLVWLAFSNHALPALPISISLAIVFYLLSRFISEQVILSSNLRIFYF